jgi:hypothetical protein
MWKERDWRSGNKQVTFYRSRFDLEMYGITWTSDLHYFQRKSSISIQDTEEMGGDGVAVKPERC